MTHWKRSLLFFGLIGALGGCGDDDAVTMDSGPSPDAIVADAGPDDGGPDEDAGTEDAGTEDAGPDEDAGPEATRFVVRIENVSGPGPIAGPVSPGVAVASVDADPFFTVDEADRGEGLAAIAEDGNAGPLGTATEGGVVFNTVEGAAMPGPAFPGDVYEFEVSALPGEALHLATMFVQSNDIFIAPDGTGIPLFDDAGAPIAETDVTESLSLWDVGSEANEAPGSGPNQAPRQSAADTGPAEGVVREHVASTHALPSAASIVRVDVTEVGGTYNISLNNISGETGTFVTPIANVPWAVHDDSVSFFTVGDPASAGIEEMAEDGSGATMLASLDGAANVVEAGNANMGAVVAGESIDFDVTPTAAGSILSFATMVVQTNDAFLALSPAGVDLFDDAGMPRSAEDVQAQIRRELVIWDAGTEADEIPGIGSNQAPRQAGANTGDADPTTGVRLYDRSTGTTNALADLSEFVNVTVLGDAGSFIVAVDTIGDGFPILTPVAWATHTAEVSLFTDGAPASAGIEALSEDGNAMPLAMSLEGLAGIGTSGVEAIPNGAAGAGPAMPGSGYTFIVTPDADNRFLSLATMLVPSNDLFLAFGPEGIALLDEAGASRSDADIATDIAAALVAWDSGTEQNQSGAAGSDQAPRQAGPDTGEAEGNGLVRLLPDGVWSYPAVNEIVRVTVRPAE